MSLPARLWTYLGERFPLGKTAILVAVFAIASVLLGAAITPQASLRPSGILPAFLVGMVLFFQMRVADEWKDHKEDARFRPERPIPRGLVSLWEITALAVVLGVLAAAVAWASGLSVLGLLAVVWLWLGLMSVEFANPAWLKARPVLYLLSHMVIMPLIALMLTSFGWGGDGVAAVGTLAVFLGLSFANGIVLEIGRKLYAPEAEREGVETYSKLWGACRAASAWMGAVTLAAMSVLYLSLALTLPALIPAATLLMLAACLFVARRYASRPDRRSQTWIDGLSGLWVLFSYAGLIIGLIYR